MASFQGAFREPDFHRKEQIGLLHWKIELSVFVKVPWQPQIACFSSIVKTRKHKNLQIRALRKLKGILLRSPKASQPLPPWSYLILEVFCEKLKVLAGICKQCHSTAAQCQWDGTLPLGNGRLVWVPTSLPAGSFQEHCQTCKIMAERCTVWSTKRWHISQGIVCHY